MPFERPFMNVAEFLRALQRSPSYKGQLVHFGTFVSLPGSLWSSFTTVSPLAAEAIRGFGAAAPLLSSGTDYERPP